MTVLKETLMNLLLCRLNPGVELMLHGVLKFRCSSEAFTVQSLQFLVVKESSKCYVLRELYVQCMIC